MVAMAKGKYISVTKTVFKDLLGQQQYTALGLGKEDEDGISCHELIISHGD